MNTQAPPLGHIAFLGGYPPRKCGIATFTHDLCNAVSRASPRTVCTVVAMNDGSKIYDYPTSCVNLEIEQEDLHSYRRAADVLNFTRVDLLCVQHEFGIFGGPAGRHVVSLLKEVRMPVVTTLHTILANPSAEQRWVMDELIRRSQRLVVMTRKGADLLKAVYGVEASRIALIAHGIPDPPKAESTQYKTQLGIGGRTVLLTYGLLGPGKGIEYAIEALPDIVRRHPDVIYIIAGATHPHLVAREGERYRLSLEKRVIEQCLQHHVQFLNRFVSSIHLSSLIGAADIYITPYLDEAQITSGTLAQVFGAGHAVVSTPYWHAQELLGERGGTLVPFRNANAIAVAVNDLLDHPGIRHSMEEHNRELGRNWAWPAVAQRYLEMFAQSHVDYEAAPPSGGGEWSVTARSTSLPTSSLRHIDRLSDASGLFQHATLTVPNFHEGYCVDDNARAFILCVKLEGLDKSQVDHDVEGAANRLATCYLAYMTAAYNPISGRFRNIMTHDRQWPEHAGSEDSHGRCLWALGVGASYSKDAGHRELSRILFERSLEIVLSFTSPRAWAFTLLGIQAFFQQHPDHEPCIQAQSTLTQYLIWRWQESSSDDWPWFEHSVTYENGRLPQALIISGQQMNQPDIVEIGLRSLAWLVSMQTTRANDFRPVGSIGFYTKNGIRADFDQQPVEAQAMVAACLAANRATGDGTWLAMTDRVFEWFIGRNDLGLPLYDPGSGGCRDGLHQDRTNKNQGAESTLAFQLALADMKIAEKTTGGIKCQF